MALLDSCINSVYEVGNIPSSAGLPPVRVLLRDPFAVAISESATAIDVLSGAVGSVPVDIVETASAIDAVDGSIVRSFDGVLALDGPIMPASPQPTVILIEG